MFESKYFYINQLELHKRLFFYNHDQYIHLHYQIVQKLIVYIKDNNLINMEEHELKNLISFIIAFSIIELHKLKESKINIKDYYQFRKSLENAVEKVQAYSSPPIYLDKYPMHPSDIFHEGLYSLLSLSCINKKIMKKDFTRELKEKFSIIFATIFGYSYSKVKMTNNFKKVIYFMSYLLNLKK